MMDGLGRLAAAGLANLVVGLVDYGLCDCNHKAEEHKPLYGTSQKGICERHSCPCLRFRHRHPPC